MQDRPDPCNDQVTPVREATTRLPLAFTQISGTHLRSLLDTLNEGIFAFDKEWHFIYTNQAGARIIGRPREEFIGRNIWQYAPSLIHTRFYTEMHNAVTQNRVIVMEDFYPAINMWLESNICPSPEGITVVSHDISDRKRQQEALRISEERLHLALDAAQLGLWFCDLPFDELIWDARTKEHFWLPPQARVTIDIFYQRLHPDDREHTRQAINQAIEQHNTYDIEYRTVSESGQIKWIRAIGKAFYDEQGTARRFDGVTLDITAQKEVETAQKALEQRKDEFISIASHELKTPITSLKGFTQLLLRSVRTDAPAALPQQELLLQRMEQQIDRLTHLVTELLDVSKIQTGNLHYIWEPIEIDAFMRDIIEAMQQTASTHRLYLHGSTNATINGDAERLRQVFTNLLSNAIKYSPHAQRVDIHLEKYTQTIAVLVRDYGLGIPPSQQDKIFDRFYRVLSHERRYVPGLGMGLYITRQIVEEHGGTIHVESQEGEGSTFTVTLPLASTKVP